MVETIKTKRAIESYGDTGREKEEEKGQRSTKKTSENVASDREE